VGLDSSILVELFDKAVAESVQPFFKRFAARYTRGESCYDAWPGPASLKQRSYQQLSGRFFWWINRFESGSVIFEIGYGEREFLIEPMLFYEGVNDRFAPWEILAATETDEPEHRLSGATWVLDAPFVQDTLCKIAGGLQQHWPMIRNPGLHALDRCRELRGKRLIFAQQEQRRRDREHASIRASAEFHAGRYAQARALLEPFRPDVELSASAAKILELSEKKMK
jgi:hypothetical protein